MRFCLLVFSILFCFTIANAQNPIEAYGYTPKIAPSYIEVLDLPLFWGIFTIWGGNCMITHGYCSCAIKMHEKNNKKETGIV